ncbi:hypothetical protein [Nitratidesulfovibrio liaohensis]|uniref:hypothetical protein n=1 Tax=Nitratidesulfovibrio liaohensis TaxID=2604158 RepID=UPI0014238C0E|nr:hypothetical protein [Nitratidesulfovibrio liaohensis]NHZ46198.1 hypothetical protein [Nitratidesulfovibrio liaohensis]
MFSRSFPGRRFAVAMLARRCLLPVTLLLALLAAAIAPGMTRSAHAADADSIIGAVDDAMRQADRARDAYDRVRSSGDRDAISRYERDWRDAEYKLEDARIENLSRESGMSPSRIRAMRESGMGWGQVAKEAGAHPGSLGVGHSKNKKGGWNRDDDHDLSRDYYRDRHDMKDGDRDGKGPRHDDGQTKDGRPDDKHAKGGKPGKGGKDKGGKGSDDYPYDDKAKGKGKK